jgi:hypothetical protein
VPARDRRLQTPPHFSPSAVRMSTWADRTNKRGPLAKGPPPHARRGPFWF